MSTFFLNFIIRWIYAHSRNFKNLIFKANLFIVFTFYNIKLILHPRIFSKIFFVNNIYTFYLFYNFLFSHYSSIGKSMYVMHTKIFFNSMLNILGFCSSILGLSGKYWNVTGISYFGNGTAGSGLNLLNVPTGIFIDSSNTLYISDTTNCRILSYLSYATNATVAAGQTGVCGSALNQLSTSMRFIYVDASGNIYITDTGNNRVMRWASGASTGVMVAGTGTGGSLLSQLSYPYGVWVDSNSNVFVTEYSNSRVTKWAPNATVGVLVAGISGSPGN
jgi:hypothetical protein